jgi:predicted permease
MRAFLRKLRWSIERRRKEEELREELEFHLAEDADERRVDGVARDEAQSAARREFGSLARITEDTRAAWGWPKAEQFTQDVKYAARMVRRTPGFAAAVIVSLALGIGANTAIFSVVYSVLLKPLPYPHAERMYSAQVVIPERRGQIPSLPATVQAYLEWRKTTTAFADISALRPWECTLTGDGEPERVGGARVSANFFSFLGVPIARGRDVAADDQEPGKERVVVISDALWHSRYGADSTIIGRSISINGESHIVVGVAPPSALVPTGTLLHPLLPFASRIDIWKPLAPTARDLRNESWDHGVLVRLVDGMNQAGGERQFAMSLNAMLHAKFPQIRTEVAVELVPLRDIFSSKIRLRLLLVLAASALLLLTACTSIANLFLARVASRGNELATRIALGAGRARILCQLLTEVALLAAGGGALGLVLARVGAGALVAAAPEEVRLLADTRLNAPLFVFATLASLVTALLCGAIPAWQAFRNDPAANLHEGARTSTGGWRAARVRQALVGVEMALATALLATAALLLHSLVNVMQADRGYQVERVLAVDLSLSGARYVLPHSRASFYETLVQHVEALPGVAAAGAISDLPAIAASSGASRTIFHSTDTDFRDTVLDRPVAMVRSVTPGYLAASGSVLRAGRFFADDEPVLVAAVSESLARRLWPGDSLSAVVGRTLRQGDVSGPLILVTGVLGDVHPGAVDRDPQPAVYRPYRQWPSGPMSIVVRTAQEPAALAAAVRAEIRKLDTTLPIPAVRTMREIVSSTVAQRRFQMTMTSLFAALALVLGMVGLYGVVSYSVACRTREIGLRMALGALPIDVMRWVFSIGLPPVLAGVTAGLALAVGAARALRGMLFGVTPLDPASIAGVAVLLLATSVVACYLPARRAASLDPAATLRNG